MIAAFVNALLLLALVHVFMVFAVDPYSLRSIITGWYNRDKSPLPLDITIAVFASKA